ncbi:type VII secretion-associated serine protease mycosin [Mycobacterium sp. QGD 101]|uniref:type VII secretion-associated serine protease mycosin n=1 Tax=Mycobacterium hubeiense TaxID=1867256 RepID=UPI000C7ED3DA
MTAAVMAVATVATGAAVPAWAVEPPTSNRDAVPPDGNPGPEAPNKKNYDCRVATVFPGADFKAVNPAVASLNLGEAWRYSRGAGQTVAVIDTGGRPHPRLPNLRPGGDYVMAGGDGFDDCDAHGTLVAGIIAAQPIPEDSFSGVAPDAAILSIRQESELFGPVDAKPVDPDDPNSTPTAGDVRTLARAIVHAANMGATVINISGVSCISALRPVDQTSLGAAVWYAAVVKDVVIVAAAGNTQGECQQNPLYNPHDPADPRDWGGVRTISTPSWFADFVLSVGALSQDGQPALSAQGGSPLTLAGPWVDAAAIGVNIVSLDPNGPGLVNAFPAKNGGLDAVNGTSFSAPVVAGLGALVRSRFPNLTAHQVIRRITETAHNPARGNDNLVGAGVVDPVAALTYAVDPGDPLPKDAWGKPIPAPVVAPPPDRRPMYTALIGLAACVVVVGGVLGLSKLRRPQR